MQQVDIYRERSRNFLVKAHEEFGAGDLEQASEKGWGAAALMVKAVAEQKGLEHRKHKQFFPVVRALARETGDSDLRRLFHVANGLHSNFYEDLYNASDVAEDLEDIKRFVEKVAQILDTVQ